MKQAHYQWGEVIVRLSGYSSQHLNCSTRRHSKVLERAFVIEVGADGRVRLENEDWTEPTLQEKRAIIYAAEEQLSALIELLDILRS